MKILVWSAMLVTVLVGVGSVSCQSHDAAQKGHIVVVKKVNQHPELDYTGVIQPAHYTLVSSPIDGHVSRVVMPYGSVVKSKDVVIEISDPGVNEDYITAVVDFLDKKEKQRRAHLKVLGEKTLFKAGVISRNDLENDQYEYDAARIAFLRALYTLKDKSRLMGVNHQKIEKLTLHELPTISKTLSQQVTVRVQASTPGLWMSPLFLKTKEETDLLAVHVGQKVEKGQGMGVVVASKGLQVRFLADYFSINALKEGQLVTLTSDVFPRGLQLKGVIDQIMRFDVHMPDSGGQGRLLFPVIVKIDQVPDVFKKVNLFGVNAQVKVSLPLRQQIRIPIEAVAAKDQGLFVVRIKGGKRQTVPVRLGAAGLKDVEVLSGLKVNDRIWVSD